MTIKGDCLVAIIEMDHPAVRCSRAQHQIPDVLTLEVSNCRSELTTLSQVHQIIGKRENAGKLDLASRVWHIYLFALKTVSVKSQKYSTTRSKLRLNCFTIHENRANLRRLTFLLSPV